MNHDCRMLRGAAACLLIGMFAFSDAPAASPRPAGFEMNARRCVDAFASGSPSAARLAELLGVHALPPARGSRWEITGVSFTAEMILADGGARPVTELNLFPAQDAMLRWRSVRAWSRSWKTVALGESSLLRAEITAGHGSGSAVVLVRLLLTPRDLDGRVLAITLRRLNPAVPHPNPRARRGK